MVVTAPEEALIGRTRESRVLRGLVEGVTRHRGGAVAVTGSAGVGKSALVRAAVEEAHRTLAGVKHAAVASLVAAEAEREWPYSGVRLVLSGVTGSLTPADRDRSALRVAEFIEGLDDDASPYVTAMRLQALASHLDFPVVVAVDDAHLLDLRSQEVLGFVARRLRPLPVALLLAGDPSAGRAPVLDGLPTLRLGPLEPDDVIAVTLSRHADVLESVAATLSRRVGANLGVLLDVVDRIPAEQRRGQVSLDTYLPTSPVLRDFALPDLGKLDGEQRLALLVTAVSEDQRFGPLVAALSDLSDDVLEWLSREHLDVFDDAFRLRVPAVGSVIWREAGLSERIRAHELLAQAYGERDPEQTLWHRALAQRAYDDELAGALQRVSGHLLRRGEFDRAVAFAEESVRLTSNPDQRVERLLISGGLALSAGRFEEAVYIARERVRMDLSVEHSAELALLEARARTRIDGQVPTGLIAGQLEVLAEADPDRAARFGLIGALGFADKVELAEAATYLATVERWLPDMSESTLGSYRRTAAWLASLSGDLDRAAELIEADSRESDVLAQAERSIRHAMVLTRLERFDEARDLLRVVTDSRRFGGSPAVTGFAHAVTAVLEIRAGKLPAAVRAQTAWQRLIGANHVHYGRVAVYMIKAHALMGDIEEAWRSHAHAQAHARWTGSWWTAARVQSETGAMLLLFNQLDEAMSLLERARDYALAYRDPSLVAAEPDFIEACVRRGERQRARAALAVYEGRVAQVPTAWAQHTMARCRALVAVDDESVDLFAVAVRMRADRVSPVELARTQLCFGERLAQLGQAAKAEQWLHRAVVLANESGATGLAARAEEALGSSPPLVVGAEPATRDELDSLTDAERRIAGLVAAGKRNREIAAELYVSVRTVEAHLGRVFRKLGVRSRAELTGVVVMADAASGT